MSVSRFDTEETPAQRLGLVPARKLMCSATGRALIETHVLDPFGYPTAGDYRAAVETREKAIVHLRARAESAEAERDDLAKLAERQKTLFDGLSARWRERVAAAEAERDRLVQELEETKAAWHAQYVDADQRRMAAEHERTKLANDLAEAKALLRDFVGGVVYNDYARPAHWWARVDALLGEDHPTGSED